MRIYGFDVSITSIPKILGAESDLPIQPSDGNYFHVLQHYQDIGYLFPANAELLFVHHII